MKIELVDVTDHDYNVIKEIYDYYVINTTATFHTEEVSLSMLKDFILTGHPKYKSFLIDYDELICGFCYLSPFKKRPAYDRTAEVTLYLKPEYTGRGIGEVVLKQLEPVALRTGIRVLIGIISSENIQSVRLFEKCGYEKCAHFKKVGEKFGKILDVVTYQKIIIETPRR